MIECWLGKKEVFNANWRDADAEHPKGGVFLPLLILPSSIPLNPLWALFFFVKIKYANFAQNIKMDSTWKPKPLSFLKLCGCIFSQDNNSNCVRQNLLEYACENSPYIAFV